MFFAVSKVFGFFFVPSSLLLTVGLLGALLLLTRFARAGRRLLAGALILLAACGFSPLGRLLLLPLEQRFPPWNPAGPAPAGIVVLGGSVETLVSVERGVPTLNEGAERVVAAVVIARQYPKARLLFSGGSGGLMTQAYKEAEWVRRLWVELGVDAARIEIEDRSRNTAENATFSKAVAQPKPGERWLLVTSASHMPRAMGIFRQAGFPVEAYPVDWRTGGPTDAKRIFTVASQGFTKVDAAVHEWVGLVVYWATGRSSALWPGPLAAGCDNAAGQEACRR